ncbi:MAG TPA: undecaprenyl-phosphate glucose phosphotransferase [Ramlibacter sp.]|nr:undecaprenyl-phosphate glucose phosphotransferase [Ramlibacter sp.]
MHDAEPLLQISPSPASPAPPPARAPVASNSRLLLAIESLVDPVTIVVALWFLVRLFEGTLTPVWLITSVIGFALAFPGRSQLRAPPRRVVASTLLNWAWMAGLLLATGYATGYIDSFSRAVVWNWLWLAPAAQLLGHWGLRRAAPQLMRLSGPPLRAVVVGMNEQGGSLADRLAAATYTGIELVGFFDDRTPDRRHGNGHHQMLGRISELAAFVKAHRVQMVYLSLPMASQPRIKELLDTLKDTTASVYFVPDMFVTDLIQGRTDQVCGLPVISVCETPFRGPDGLVKRGSDVVLATLILLLLSPLMAAIAVAVKLTSPGPAIFRQRRYGLDGQEIVVYKFRSMTVAQDGPEVPQARRGDPRVTPLGAFLRKSSMDELPQFVNVLQGRMSIVGPRPHAVAHNEFYRPLIKSYMIRHKVKPGITGWAQINGFRGETDSLDKMQGRLRCDLDYLRNWSLQLDLYIIAKTVQLVFKDHAAY